MRCFTLGLALVVATPVMSAEEPPFSIEAPELLTHAFSLLKKQYPEVSPHDLELPSPVFFNCFSIPPVAGPSALEGATIRCVATINFDLTATGIEFTYHDSEGNCMIVNPPEIAMIRIGAEGSGRIHLNRGSENEGEVIACDEEAISQMAVGDQRLKVEGKPFSIDAKRVLKTAFAVAASGDHELALAKLVFDDDLSVTCETPPGLVG